MGDLVKEAAEFIKQMRKPTYLQEAEKIIGRPLEDYETIIFKDGNKHNTSPLNLMVGFKAGVPYQYLTCRNCGARAMSQSVPEEHPQHPVDSAAD